MIHPECEEMADTTDSLTDTDVSYVSGMGFTVVNKGSQVGGGREQYSSLKSGIEL